MSAVSPLSRPASSASPLPGQFVLLSRILHWLMVVMIFAMLFIGVWMVASLSHYHTLVAVHRPLGICILLVVSVRLITRLATRTPPLPPTVPPPEKVVAYASEVLMYVLMFAMPLIGWGMLSAGDYPVVMVGSFHLPHILPARPMLFAVLRRTHTVLAYLLFLTVVGHMSAILFHTLIVRDRLLDRMAIWPHSQE